MKSIIFTIMFAFAASLVGCGQDLAGCSQWESLPIPVNAIQEYEIEAIEEMNAAFGRELFVINTEGVSINYVEFGGPELDPGKTGRGNAYCGSDGIITSGEVFIADIYEGGPAIRNLVAHELFHVLGFFQHTESGLMNEDAPIGRRDVLDPLDDLITQELRDWVNETYGAQTP